MFLTVLQSSSQKHLPSAGPRNSLLSLDVPMRWHQAHPQILEDVQNAHNGKGAEVGECHDVGINVYK